MAGQSSSIISQTATNAKSLNESYNTLASILNNKYNKIDLKTKVESNTLIGTDGFNLFSGIKKGTVSALQGITSISTAVTAFSGDWSDPMTSITKLADGLSAIVSATKYVSETLVNAGTSIEAIGNKLVSFGTSTEIINGVTNTTSTHPVLNKIGAGVVSTAAVIKSTGNKLSTEKEKEETNSDQKNSNNTNGAKNNSTSDDTNTTTTSEDGSTSELTSTGDINSEAESGESTEDSNSTTNSSDTESNNSSLSSGGSKSDAANSAEFVSELKFILDGAACGNNSECNIGGVDYLVSSYTLDQEMLTPVTLSFTIMKKSDVEETDKDITYDACRLLMGKSLEVQVSTKTIDKDADASSFVFKGLITDISASRGAGASPYITVTANTYEWLLDASPNCRSFENKTLQEIVNKIISPYSDIEAKINPRYKETIPYIVQYNISDYDFLTMLARRFGEWMYSTGKTFIFGEVVSPLDSVVKMRYPGGNIFSYGIRLSLRDFTFTHVTNDLYDNDIKSRTGEGEAERELHIINEEAYKVAKNLFTVQDINYLGTGGVFDDGTSEKTDDILTFSTKVEARGKKAQMLVTSGQSKVAKLFLGQTFEIEDGVENKSGQKKEIQQKPLMVLEARHSFDLMQEYSNSFRAIPSTCDYPPYSTADVYGLASPQRAVVVDNKDPQNLGRIRVQFPWQKIAEQEGKEDEHMWTPWIRISQSYGGLEKGSQFIPELNEEVMIGFEMNNVERPYMMGTLFNGEGSPDHDWSANTLEGTANNIKGVRTRSGHTIVFCDSNDGGDIQIYDYKKNNYFLQLSTDEKCIRIHAKGNVEVVAGNDITMKADKNIVIEAGENITIKSGKDTDITSEANMSIEVENNMQQEATDIYVKASDSISEESDKSHIIKTKTLQEKASKKASYDGGDLLEITAGKVRVMK